MKMKSIFNNLKIYLTDTFLNLLISYRNNLDKIISDPNNYQSLLKKGELIIPYDLVSYKDIAMLPKGCYDTGTVIGYNYEKNGNIIYHVAFSRYYEPFRPKIIKCNSKDLLVLKSSLREVLNQISNTNILQENFKDYDREEDEQDLKENKKDKPDEPIH